MLAFVSIVRPMKLTYHRKVYEDRFVNDETKPHYLIGRKPVEALPENDTTFEVGPGTDATCPDCSWVIAEYHGEIELDGVVKVCVDARCACGSLFELLNENPTTPAC